MSGQADGLLKSGQKVEVTIAGTGHHGEGVGHVGRIPVFVPGGMPGDTVRVALTDVKRRYARGEIQAVVQSASRRIGPPCPVADTCGGCQIQHVDYAFQLDLKRQRVVDALTRIGGLHDVTVHPVIGMARPWFYRNKAQFPVGMRNGDVVYGFYAPRSHDIVPISTCYIQQPATNEVMRTVRDLLQHHQVSIYDESTHEGLLRHVIVRAAAGTGHMMVVFVINGTTFPVGASIANVLMHRHPSVVSVVQNTNTAKTNVITGRKWTVIAGDDHIVDTVGGLKFRLSPPSFFQVNPTQMEVLYDCALGYAALTGDEEVIDVYCGIGTITLQLAGKARTVWGIDDVPEAIVDAKRNASLNRVANARFVAGDAAATMTAWAREERRPDVVVLDPPRKGCDEAVIDAIVKMSPEKVVYVSCHPESLARDLALLHAAGYTTEEVQPVDMFPHTAHVECVAGVRRNR